MKRNEVASTRAKGALLAEGKTKRIFAVEGDIDEVIVESKNDITAGDGAKHDVFEGKGMFSNCTTSAVFEYLIQMGHPMAYICQLDPFRFTAARLNMLPYEVVVRGKAYGSYLKRHPGVAKGDTVKPVAEFYLKTSGKVLGGQPIPCDDPLMVFSPDFSKAELFLPNRPVSEQQSFMTLQEFPFVGDSEAFDEMASQTLRIYDDLRDAWQLFGGDLVDLKVEYGTDSPGSTDYQDIILGDVIDNDSWRVMLLGHHLDKQAYREGSCTLEEVMQRYRIVQAITAQWAEM